MAIEVFLGLALVAPLGGLLRYVLPDLDVDDLRQKLNRLVLTGAADHGRQFHELTVVHALL